MDKQQLDELSKQWVPINVDACAVTPKAWTEGGFDCLTAQRVCSNCPYGKTTGKSWQNPDKNKRCFQPISVQKLLNKVIKAGFRGTYTAHHKTKNWA